MIPRNLYHYLASFLLCLSLLTACDAGGPITKPVTVVMFGDSLTDGYKLPTEQAVPARIQAHFLADGHTGVRVMNMGISGDTTQGGLARLNLALDKNPDVVVLELGANDMMRRIPVAEARKNLAEMIEALQARNIIVILCGVQVPAVFILGNEQLGEYKTMFRELSDDYNLDFYSNFLKGVQGKRDLNLEDGLHPNAKGAQVIADKLYPMVRDAAYDAAARK